MIIEKLRKMKIVKFIKTTSVIAHCHLRLYHYVKCMKNMNNGLTKPLEVSGPVYPVFWGLHGPTDREGQKNGRRSDRLAPKRRERENTGTYAYWRQESCVFTQKKLSRRGFAKTRLTQALALLTPIPTSAAVAAGRHGRPQEPSAASVGG